MGWFVFAVLGIIDLLTVLTMLTDGRYFGSRLTRWRNLVEALQSQEDEGVWDANATDDDLSL